MLDNLVLNNCFLKTTKGVNCYFPDIDVLEKVENCPTKVFQNSITSILQNYNLMRLDKANRDTISQKFVYKTESVHDSCFIKICYSVLNQKSVLVKKFNIISAQQYEQFQNKSEKSPDTLDQCEAVHEQLQTAKPSSSQQKKIEEIYRVYGQHKTLTGMYINNVLFNLSVEMRIAQDGKRAQDHIIDPKVLRLALKKKTHKILKRTEQNEFSFYFRVTESNRDRILNVIVKARQSERGSSPREFTIITAYFMPAISVKGRFKMSQLAFEKWALQISHIDLDR